MPKVVYRLVIAEIIIFIEKYVIGITFMNYIILLSPHY